MFGIGVKMLIFCLRRQYQSTLIDYHSSIHRRSVDSFIHPDMIIWKVRDKSARNSLLWSLFHFFVLLRPSVCDKRDGLDTQKPNLIIIMTDEQSVRTLGCYRDKMTRDQAFQWGDGLEVDTPNIDRFAKEGALYTNYFTSSPQCTPSRASFLSGMYPEATGAAYNDDAMDKNTRTFANDLKDANYNTAYIGKFHLDGERNPDYPGWKRDYDVDRKFGFDFTKFMYNSGHWKAFKKKPDGTTKAFTGKEWPSAFEEGRLREENYTTDFLFKRATNYIKGAMRKKNPFALFLSIPDPHAPFEVRKPYDSMFDDAVFEPPETLKAAFKMEPAPPKWAEYSTSKSFMYLERIRNAQTYKVQGRIQSLRNEPKWNRKKHIFGMIKLIDDKVGELLSFLKRRKLDKNTIVVFTSDHGALMGEHGLEHKNQPYKASAGIPMIIRYPGNIKPGKVIETAHVNVDFAPTILSLMGVSSNVTFHGSDGSQELLNSDLTVVNDDTKFITHPGPKTQPFVWAAAVNNKYKLVLSGNSVPWLFDLENDPDELHNVYSWPKNANVTAKMKSELLDAIEQYNFPIGSSKFLHSEEPVCYDRRSHIPGDHHMFCKHLKNPENKHQCNTEKVSNRCRISCGQCCENTKDILWNGNSSTCEEILIGKTFDEKKHLCEEWSLKLYCPLTCGICRP